MNELHHYQKNGKLGKAGGVHLKAPKQVDEGHWIVEVNMFPTEQQARLDHSRSMRNAYLKGRSWRRRVGRELLKAISE